MGSYLLDVLMRSMVGTVTKPAMMPAKVGSCVSVKDRKCGTMNVKMPVIRISLEQMSARRVHKALTTSKAEKTIANINVESVKNDGLYAVYIDKYCNLQTNHF